MAAQQLVSVLGGKTGELAAMCEQLCFDFDDNPMGLDCVNQYLTANPQVTGFAVADKAVEGKTAEAIVMMRAAVEQGTDPIALPTWRLDFGRTRALHPYARLGG